jgi:glycosyltransferase involved in cell wall biosynthesis
MRVLHVLGGLHAAGIESLALQLISHAPAGVQCELLNADLSAQAMAAAFEQLQRNGRLKALHQWSRCDGPRLAWRSFRLCLRRRPDALLVYPCSRPMLWLALGARLAGVQRLAVHLGNPAPADSGRLHTWHRLMRWFQRLGVLAVPCSQAILESLQPLPRGLRLGAVITNGCDTQAIAQRAAAARAQRPPGDPYRVLMVARLDPIKDQATLLTAFAAARQPGWELQLVGDGPDRPRLEALARALGLDPAQVFLGRRSDIPELLGQADLFAFSTTTAEGFGIALIEALAASLPVVASDVPACREVLRDGDAGDLLPAGDVEAWANRLGPLLRSKSKRQALAAQATAHANLYDIHSVEKSWIQLLANTHPNSSLSS